jgi:hypothetical protein
VGDLQDHLFAFHRRIVTRATAPGNLSGVGAPERRPGVAVGGSRPSARHCCGVATDLNFVGPDFCTLAAVPTPCHIEGWELIAGFGRGSGNDPVRKLLLTF